MQASDVPAAHRLSSQAGWNQTPADWHRLLQLEPEGCFALDLAGQVVGTVTTTRHGSQFAWIGMMLVEAAHRRQGFGRRLLSHALAWLHGEGIGAVMLDATPLGQPLYEGLGFRRQDALDRWQGVAAGGDHAIPSLRTAELSPTLLGLDQRAFGVDRSRLLRGLQQAPGALSFATGDEEAASGFLLLRPGAQRWHIGPLVATDEDAAGRLLQAALATLAGQPLEIDVPRRAPARAIVRRAGLAPARPFVRMLRGGPAPAVQWQLLYAGAAPEYG